MLFNPPSTSLSIIVMEDSAVNCENIFHTTWICNDPRRLEMQITDQFGQSSTVQIIIIIIYIFFHNEMEVLLLLQFI